MLNFISAYRQHQGFPGGSVVKHLLANAGATADMGFIPGWKDALEEETQPAPGFLSGKSHGQRSLAGCSS